MPSQTSFFLWVAVAVTLVVLLDDASGGHPGPSDGGPNATLGTT